MKASKKSFPFLLVTLTLFLGMTAFAQDEEKTKVHLKVMQNDEVTVDTTLHITSGADSDELKKLIQGIAGIEDIDLQVLRSGDLHTHAIKLKKEGTDSLKSVAVFVGEKDLEKLDEDKVGAYYVVKEKTDLDDVEEIVIKKKDGSIIIMKGDEIQDIKGGSVYIKTHNDEAGTFDVFLKNDKDGTVVVKNNVKVTKKQNKEGEAEIEITIVKKDTTEEKKEIKEKKAEKEKK